MKILMSGGAGFIGTSLIKELIDNNEIVVVDTLERDALTKEFGNHQNLKMIYHDITNPINEKIDYELHDADIIIHLAAVAGVDNVLQRPVRTMEVNMIGTYNILTKAVFEYLKTKKLKRFINFSTSEVYGPYTYKLGENEFTSLGAVGEARWSYSVSKLAGEHLAFAYHQQHGFPVVSIRPFNIYGPRQVGEGAIQIFIKKAIVNDTIEIHGDGSAIRSWCYISDAVDFIIKCIYCDEVNGQVLNMGNPGGTITTVGLAEKVIRVSKSKSKIVFVPKPYCDVELRIPNIEKAKELLGYEPKVCLEKGIYETFKWFKKGMVILNENSDCGWSETAICQTKTSI